MAVTFRNNYLRAHAREVKYILPGDVNYGIAQGGVPCGVSVPLLDNAAFDLMQLVAKKGWDVPGIDVVCTVDGTDNHPIHRVVSLSGGYLGEKWRIQFDRCALEDKNGKISAAADYIAIPGGAVRLHEDGSSSYYHYIGKNWEADEGRFIKGVSMGRSKELGLPRRYLSYDLSAKGAYEFTDRNGAEYAWNEKENWPYDIGVFDTHMRITSFLDDVIARVEKFPDAQTNPYELWRRYTHLEEISVPCNMPVLYMTETCLQGKAPTSFPYGGQPLSTNRYDCLDKHALQAIAENRTFRYAYERAPFYDSIGLWGAHPLAASSAFYEVKLRWSNDVFVADRKPFHDCRNYLLSEKGEDQLFTEEERALQFATMAKTIVKLQDYRYDYDEPVYLINRSLGDDEICDISSQVRMRSDENAPYHFRPTAFAG